MPSSVSSFMFGFLTLTPMGVFKEQLPFKTPQNSGLKLPSSKVFEKALFLELFNRVEWPQSLIIKSVDFLLSVINRCGYLPQKDFRVMAGLWSPEDLFSQIEKAFYDQSDKTNLSGELWNPESNVWCTYKKFSNGSCSWGLTIYGYKVWAEASCEKTASWFDNQPLLFDSVCNFIKSKDLRNQLSEKEVKTRAKIRIEYLKTNENFNAILEKGSNPTLEEICLWPVQNWLTQQLKNGLQYKLETKLKTMLPTSFTLGEGRDIIHDWLLYAWTSESLSHKISTHYNITFSTILFFVRNRGFSKIRDLSRDAHSRNFRLLQKGSVERLREKYPDNWKDRFQSEARKTSTFDTYKVVKLAEIENLDTRFNRGDFKDLALTKEKENPILEKISSQQQREQMFQVLKHRKKGNPKRYQSILTYLLEDVPLPEIAEKEFVSKNRANTLAQHTREALRESASDTPWALELLSDIKDLPGIEEDLLLARRKHPRGNRFVRSSLNHLVDCGYLQKQFQGKIISYELTTSGQSLLNTGSYTKKLFIV